MVVHADADDVTKVEKIIIKDSLTAAGSDATLVVNENIKL